MAAPAESHLPAGGGMGSATRRTFHAWPFGKGLLDHSIGLRKEHGDFRGAGGDGGARGAGDGRALRCRPLQEQRQLPRDPVLGEEAAKVIFECVCSQGQD